MRAVGIRELKARISEYLRLVKAGESVLVTEHDRVIAEIRPAARQEPQPDTVDHLLESLSEAGVVTLRADSPRLKSWPSSHQKLIRLSLSAAEILDDLRKDRA